MQIKNSKIKNTVNIPIWFNHKIINNNLKIIFKKYKTINKMKMKFKLNRKFRLFNFTKTWMEMWNKSRIKV